MRIRAGNFISFLGLEGISATEIRAFRAGQGHRGSFQPSLPGLVSADGTTVGVATAGSGFANNPSVSTSPLGGRGDLGQGKVPAAGAYPGPLAQHSPLYPVLVAGDVLGIKQLVGG